MSRTKKGKKPPGFDYWTKRPGNIGGINGHGPSAKKITKRRERALDKILEHKAKNEQEEGSKS